MESVKAMKIYGKDLWNQLERVSIPVFSGDKTTYEGWREAFNACVDKAPVSAVYKLLQLKKYLSGEPLKLVERLGHSSRAYETAKDKLNRKYGGKRHQTTMYLKQLESFKPLKDGDSKSFEAFADLLETAVFTLREADRMEELGNGTLYTTIINKLTDKQMVEFLRWSDEKSIEESVESLMQWSLRESEFSVISSETKLGFNGSAQKAYFVVEEKDSIDSSRNTVPRCSICREDHFVSNCQKFLSMSCSDRWSSARAHGLCFRCLCGKHIGRDCKQKKQCGIQGCNNSHHRLLHRGIDVSTEPEPREPFKDNVHSFRTVPVILRNGNRSTKINALLDDASSKSYLNSDVAYRLGLSGHPETVNVSVVNGGTEKIDSMSVDVRLQSVDGAIDHFIMVNTADSVTGDVQVVDWSNEAGKWPHLKDIPFPKLADSGHIDMLIGLDHPDLHFSMCDIRGKRENPSARNTPLGWTCVCGPRLS